MLVYGLDVGTQNFLICLNDKIVSEKNVIAKKNGEVLSIGDEAYEMFEKSPDEIEITFPVKKGVIADIDDMQKILVAAIRKINETKKKVSNATFYIALPTDVTQVEKRAFYELVLESVGVKDILLVDRPMADAIGANVDVKNTNGTIIVNLGASKCEISFISKGEIVKSKTIFIAGDSMDSSIINMLKSEYNLLIGKKSAKLLKEKLGNASFKTSNKCMKVFGRNLLTGLPVSMNVDENDVHRAIKDILNNILEEVKILIESIKDLSNCEIILTGGLSNLTNLAEIFFNATDIRCKKAENPERTIISGLSKILKDVSLATFTYHPYDDEIY